MFAKYAYLEVSLTFYDNLTLLLQSCRLARFISTVVINKQTNKICSLSCETQRTYWFISVILTELDFVNQMCCG